MADFSIVENMPLNDNMDSQDDYSFCEYIKYDFLRYAKNLSFYHFLTTYFFNEGFQYTVWMRAAFSSRRYSRSNPFHWLCRFQLRRLSHKYGISIPYNAKIGPGFYIGHFGGIVINPKATIGKNCNISCGVILGETFRLPNKGTPVIGDYVYIGPGAKIIGSIKIGDNTAIGTNSVVTKDIPSNCVAVGVPAKVISSRGSEEYVRRVV